MALLTDWNVIREFSDGKIDNKDGININSSIFTVARDDVFSHFKVLMFFKTSFSVTVTNEFTWQLTGNTFFSGQRKIPPTILNRTSNALADARLASSGVLLLDASNSLLFGFLFTRQVVHIITARHPIPPLENFKEWRQNATLDEYTKYTAFLEHASSQEVPWLIWLKRYDPLDYKDAWLAWRKVGTEPAKWSDWCFFQSSFETHAALLPVYERKDEDEVINVTLVVTPLGVVTWRINDVDVFEQVKVGVRLLDKQQAVDTGAVNFTPTVLRLTPAIGTFSWIDFVDSEHKCPPFVALAKKYFDPIHDKLGRKRKLSRSKAFLAKHSTQAQLFGQGATLSVKSYVFGPPTLIGDGSGGSVVSVSGIKVPEPPIVVDMRLIEEQERRDDLESALLEDECAIQIGETEDVVEDAESGDSDGEECEGEGDEVEIMCADSESESIMYVYDD